MKPNNEDLMNLLSMLLLEGDKEVKQTELKILTIDQISSSISSYKS